MEKRRPHYNLKEIKKAFADPDNLGVLTGSARDGARALRISDEDIAAIIGSLSIRDFYKSMTSRRDHKIWQDVYFPSYQNLELYVKFTRNVEDKRFVLISFKKSSQD